jgi:flagellar basal-body rod modification protein FlgD
MTTPIPGSNASTPLDGSSGGNSAALDNTQMGPSAFLQLLVAELKNQDPTQPMDPTTMISQLAQLNQTQYAQQGLTAQQETLASSIIGKSVTGTEDGAKVTGTATSFTYDGTNVNLIVNGKPMSVSSVTQVATTDTTSTNPASTDGGNA